MVDAKRWMNTQDVAEYLGVKKNTIYSYVAENRIPYYTLPGSRYKRFDADEIDEWVKSGRTSQLNENIQGDVQHELDEV